MRTGFWLLAGSLLLACSSKGTHAAPASNACMVPPCGANGPAIGGSTGGTGSTGSADAGPVSTPDGGGGIVAGAVVVFDDQGFVATHRFNGSGTATVFGAAGPAGRHTATFGGSSYSVAVQVASPLWVGIQSTTSSEVMPTLMAVDARMPTAADVGFAQAAMLALIFSGLQTNPQTMQNNKAQLAVRFVDSSGTPLPGVQIALAPAGAIVAYDNGSLYSDLPAFAATQARGMAVLLNVPASLWPGSKVTINYQHGTPAVLGAFDVFLAQGAVTFVTITPPK